MEMYIFGLNLRYWAATQKYRKLVLDYTCALRSVQFIYSEMVSNEMKFKTLLLQWRWLADIYQCTNNIKFGPSIKYIRLVIARNLSDELDIKARVRSVYCTANMLRNNFFKCSVKVKNILFRSFSLAFMALTFGAVILKQVRIGSCSIQ